MVSTRKKVGKLPGRVRSTLKLSAFFGVLGTLIGFCWEWNFVSHGALGLGAFLLVVVAFEYWASCLEQTVQMDSEEQRGDRFLSKPDSLGFQLVDRNGDLWHERMVEIDGVMAIVRMPADQEAFTRALPFARKIIDDPQRVAVAFREFKQTVSNQIPSEEVMALKIDVFAFLSRSKPDFAEVLFHPTPSGRYWVAIYTNSEFQDLLEET